MDLDARERRQGVLSEDAIEAQLAAMRRRYAQTSRGFIATFELIGAQLANAPDSDDLITPLRRELHRVQGTAGSLGFHEAGRMAGAMEGLCRRWREDPALDRNRRSSIVLSFARALDDAIAATADDDAPTARHLVLLGLADVVADRLVAEGLHRGLAVERFADESSAMSSRTVPPWAVIAMEGSTPGESPAGFQGAVCVYLRDASRMSHSRQSSGATVLDVDTAPSRIIDALGMLAAQRGAMQRIALLVDDDPMMLLLVRAVVEDRGLSVEIAANGAVFRNVIARMTPALVVLDVELPDASGIDLLRELRASGDHRHVPVLMLSGRSDGDTRTAAFEAGADDYMLKPVVPAELQGRLARLLEVRRERLTSTGLHSESELPLPARTVQEIDARLAGRASVEWSLGVMRPAVEPHLPDEIAQWHAESLRLARAVKEVGGTAGLTDIPGLAIAVPLAPAEAERLLRTLAGNAERTACLWHGGLAGTTTVPSGTSRAMLSAATNAYAAARDANVCVRIWDPSDVGIAPDVIVVEDDPSLTEMLEFALDAKGLSHRSYATGPEALDALLRLRTDEFSPIVLLDIDLPGMDGHSVHERLRMERPGDFQVVFLSLHTSEADQLRALQGGALDFLTKPINLRILMAKLAVWRQRSRSG